MDYNEALNYIHSTPKFSRVLGNDLLSKLLDKLGNPQDKLKFIHIAGTNGKGSTAIMLAEILMLSGLRVGLFTSPYIECFNERIRVNGEVIPNDALAEITTNIKATIERFDTPVSEFALDTAIAFEYFYKEKCDIVVLETGLGGRLDATNVIKTNVASVLTAIGLDHTQYLGNTIAEITAEKCGIIKGGSPTVLYPIQDKEVIPVVEDFCHDKNSDLIIADIPDIKGGNEFVYKNVSYTLSLGGDFQKYNASTAIEVILHLRTVGYNISDFAIKQGLLNASNPARFELLSSGVILDGAHNPPAITALCDSLKNMGKRVNLSIAMMEDKDISKCISLLSKIASSVIVTEIDMPRCASAEYLKAEFSKFGVSAVVEKSPTEAVSILIKSTKPDEIACVCGSLYFAGIVRKHFNK